MKLLKYLTIPFLAGALGLAACSEEASKPNLKIGVVSDIECMIDNAKTSASRLKTQSVDMIIIAGDNYENEKLRGGASKCPGSTDNVKEMVDGITPYAKLGVPVYVIPGNHEERAVYEKAIAELKKKFPNVQDLHELKTVDLKGVNIVGLGGYHHPRFTTPNGYLLGKNDYVNALTQLRKFQAQKEPTIFVTHGPPFSKTRIDYVHGVGHVGDVNLTYIMSREDLENIINTHGHIHQGGGHQDSTYKAGTSFNVASVTSFLNPRAPRTGVILMYGMEGVYKELK